MQYRFVACLALVWVIVNVGNAADGTDWDTTRPYGELEPRTVAIDVDEGTWMSLDVSSDGQHVVFDLLGDIYRVPIEGGAAERLLAGLAWEIQPRFSPDGTELAFISDRSGGDNVWVMDLATSTTRQVTFEPFRLLNNPTWSPDGRFIAARKHFTTSRSLGTGEIWLYHAHAGKENKGIVVVERPGAAYQKELGEPMYSPDGRALYYTKSVTPGNTFIYREDSNGELFQIHSVDLTSGESTTIAGGPGGAVRPTPSPNGRWLAFVKRVRAESRLFVQDLATGEQRMLVDDLDPDMQETWAVYGFYPNMDWTPDSQSIVFWAGGKIRRVDVDSGAVRDIPFTIRDEREVYPAPRYDIDVDPDRFETRMVRFATPSPDDSTVVFESLGRLYVKSGDDDPRRLTRDSSTAMEYSPVFSPDGRTVYFLRWDDVALSSLHSVAVRGGRVRSLEMARGQFDSLAISADGRHLAFRKLAGSALLHPEFGVDPGLYLYDIEARTSRRVRESGFSPRFVGDDERLYLLDRKRPSGRGSDTAKTQLISTTFDGLDERLIAESEHGSDIQLSPDRRYIAFIENFELSVAAYTGSANTVALGHQKKALPGRRVSREGALYLHWSNDGSRLSWSSGPRLSTIDVNDDLLLGEAEIAVAERNLSMIVASARPQQTLAFTNARVITMDAARTVHESGTIVVVDNRIVAVGPSAATTVPEGATVVPLDGKTIIPGLIDAHAHGPYGRGEIIPQQNWSVLAHLALGVTTLQDPSSNASVVFATAEYARSGRVLAPRILSTGNIVYGARGTSWVPIDDLEDAKNHVDRLVLQGATSIKNYNQPRRNQRQQVIAASREAGVISVAEGGSLFHMDMNLIADGSTGIEHNVPPLDLYDDVVQFWAQSDAGYTPTLVVTYGGLTAEDYYYQRDEVWKHPILSAFVPPTVLQPRAVRRVSAPAGEFRDDRAARGARRLMDAGVLVSIGAHGQREGLASHWEMWSFVRGGMTALQALATATINPAEHLGLQNDLGSIENGKLADLVILNANPLDDIHHTDDVSHVVLNGHIFDAATLDERFSGEARLRPFWWHERPEAAIR